MPFFAKVWRLTPQKIGTSLPVSIDEQRINLIRLHKNIEPLDYRFVRYCYTELTVCIQLPVYASSWYEIVINAPLDVDESELKWWHERSSMWSALNDAGVKEIEIGCKAQMSEYGQWSFGIIESDSSPGVVPNDIWPALHEAAEKYVRFIFHREYYE